ncbi:hypothetical protein HQ489_02690 [Candidatus Woesearchaeota archaeon]|nr:hypothetical protein [Candidatus Woesearchaeota archaeon]
MKLGLVLDVVQEKDNYIFAHEVIPFLRYALPRIEVYVVQPEDYKNINGTMPVYHLNDKLRKDINPLELDGIYFGHLGQAMDQQDTSLTNTLPDLCKLFEQLKPYRAEGLTLLNRPETMLNFVSKRYILDMAKETDIPFIESEEVKSLDHLLELSQRQELMLVKPFISERSNGTIVLNGKSKEELRKHYETYCGKKIKVEGESPLFTEVKSQQGLIAQPYCPDFVKIGEVKIGIMGGEITLSRIHQLEESTLDIPIVAAGRKDAIVKLSRYTPTSQEAELAMRVYEIVNKQFPIYNLRVDLANGKVSEIEALNPCFLTDSDVFSDEEITQHHERLLKGFGQY